MRIVSLCPSLTDLAFALGRGGDLVGATRFCIRPAEARQVPRVGGTKDPDLARVVALQPDLVLMNAEENRREDHDALTRAGLHCLATLPRTPLEAAAVVRAVGAAVRREHAASAIATEIEIRTAAAHARARGSDPVGFVCLAWRRPWMAVGAGTYGSALLEACGGVNLLADKPGRYPEVEVAELRAVDPPGVVLPSEPFPFRERHAIELAQATGLPRERFRLADGQLLFWHGALTPNGLAHADRLLRG